MPLRLTTLGVGAAASPRFRPAGLLIEAEQARVMIDGGARARPAGELDAWLVTDEHAELMPEIRRVAAGKRLRPAVERVVCNQLMIEPRPVVHTSHPSFGYLIRWMGKRIVWAPEFYRFPRWARNAEVMFADASGWEKPIRFRCGVGGHLDALTVSRSAQRNGVKRLIFAHIGRPTIRAIDRGDHPPFGEFAHDRQVFTLR